MTNLVTRHDELAEIANREYLLAERSAQDTVAHMIACGQALLEVFEDQPYKGYWGEWLSIHFTHVDSRTAQRYVRLAKYKEELGDITGLPYRDALSRLAGLPAIGGPKVGYDDEFKREVLEAINQPGATLREVSRRFGISRSSIINWQDPEDYRKRAAQAKRAERARRKAARLAEQQRKRDEAAKRVNGNIGKAYSDIRKLAQTLDRAEAEAPNRESRIAVSNALRLLHRAEDEIVRALGVS